MKVPYVLTIYDLISERFNLQNDKFIKRNLIKKAKHIICISNFTKSELMKIYDVPKDKISVVYLADKRLLQKLTKEIYLFVEIEVDIKILSN